jgi:hypothetical protein
MRQKLPEDDACQLAIIIGPDVQVRALHPVSPSLGSEAGGANRLRAHRGYAGRDAGRHRVTGVPVLGPKDRAIPDDDERLEAAWPYLDSL